MPTRLLTALIGAAIFSSLPVAAGFPALAQSSTAGPNGVPGPTGQPSGASGSALPTRNAPAARQGDFLTELPAGGSRVSKMIGVPVIGSDIHRLGKVADVLIDRGGAAQAVVIDAGGVLGIGARSVAVPFAAMLWNYDVRPTDGPSSSNTGGAPADGATQVQSATAPRPDTPPDTTGTVGDPAQPNEGLTPQGATVAVTGNGAPREAVLRITQQELNAAPEFKTPR
jgi:hypothetical protein